MPMLFGFHNRRCFIWLVVVGPQRACECLQGGIRYKLIRTIIKHDYLINKRKEEAMHNIYKCAGCVLGGVLSLQSAGLLAQERRSVGLEEIIVTAQKCEESLTDVPYVGFDNVSGGHGEQAAQNTAGQVVRYPAMPATYGASITYHFL